MLSLGRLLAQHDAFAFVPACSWVQAYTQSQLTAGQPWAACLISVEDMTWQVWDVRPDRSVVRARKTHTSFGLGLDAA